MKILVLNCGSSSLKFQLIETAPERISSDTDEVLARGQIEKIGSGAAIVTYERTGSPRVRESRPILKHEDAIRAAFDFMTAPNGVIQHLEEIEAVGHRIVHGGEHFRESTLLEPEVVKQIEAAIPLAPLHNPHNLKGYYAAAALIPHAKNVAVFDTAFHQTMPEAAFLYGLPYLYYTRDKIRRYGFHGTSHRYVCHRYAQLHHAVKADFKLITCHLGNGCSVCAIGHGKSLDTSMGLTPLEGLLMGTRPGDLDPGAVMYLIDHAEMGAHEVDVVLNKQSGLYGISGLSNDMRDLMDAAAKGNDRAALAIEVFCYRIKKYIAAYLGVLNGADGIVFAGGIGENAPAIRAKACAALDVLGVAIDTTRNQAAIGKEAKISPDSAKPEVWVIPTNEELLIARDTLRCVLKIPHP